MYVNERDQINYHGFLRALREMNQVSQECVSKGICTVSGMNRFENGNRLAEKLMRDRLTARLGISGETYEDYLQPKEYKRWEHRLCIIKAIEHRDLAKAKEELNKYESLSGLNRVNVQFVETMRYMILSLDDAPFEEQLECIQKAIKCTVPNVKKALAGEHLLSVQEINLIAEQLRVCPPKKHVIDERGWRIGEYEKLISYMDSSCWEKLQKAKIYPKVVNFICNLLLTETPSEEECRHGLELCNNAIELLRDTCRLFYFIELTETRRALAKNLLSYDIAEEEKIALEEMLRENNTWERVLKELYEEYKVAPYMSDFCYLYYETECHDMVEVIETRRKMLGLSRVKLGDGICTDRTIVRFEREGRNPSVDLVRLLFEKMGMCAEYRRSQIIVSDSDALIMYFELLDKINGLENRAAEKYILALSEKLNMNIAYNMQEIGRLSNLVAFRNKEISQEELKKRAIDSFQITIPIVALETGIKNSSTYLTRAEIECAYDIAFYGNGKEYEVCREYVNQRCKSLLDDFQPSMIPTVELLLTRYASELGDNKSYHESNLISEIVLKECLFYRRIHYVAENLYNIIFNSIESQQCDASNKNDLLKAVEKCISISCITKENDWMTFFQNKYQEMIN